MTLLDAINYVLVALGQAPVNDPDTQHDDVLIAKSIIALKSKEVQSRGYWFNTDDALELAPNIAGEVILPGGTLSADPVDTLKHLVVRGSRFYDPVKSTYNIGESIKALVVTELPLSDLPFVAFDLIQKMAARKVVYDQVGDEQKDGKLKEDVFLAERALGSEHIRNSDFNALHTPQGLKVMSGIRPGYRRR